MVKSEKNQEDDKHEIKEEIKVEKENKVEEFLWVLRINANAEKNQGRN